jgi:iron complex outermembrane receptor protein
MKAAFHSMALAVAAALSSPVHAQTAGKPGPGAPATVLSPVVVTGNPLGSGLFDLVSPVSALYGQDLLLLRRSTLGETLNELPGVSSSYFGPNASRPVIRGLDSDRIRILQNGAGMIDASSLSQDHATAVDPLIVERAEVVRGPAALLYGGAAVGGVVNVIDNRIPLSPVQGAGGRAEGRFGGAEREKGGAAMFEAGNGRFALHADAYTRDTDDLKIKGPNVSSRLQAQDPTLPVTTGTLPNSASNSGGGALGGSVHWGKGMFGLSYSGFDSKYGTIAEPGVTVDMRSDRFDLAGELRELGSAITGVKLKLGHTDYKHTELDAGAPATRFNSKGYDARVEALHGAIGGMKGAFGVQLTKFDFSALGDEAFVPSTNTDAKAAFLYEELPIGRLKLSFGGRYENTDVRSDGGGVVPFGGAAPRFDPAQTRSFSGTSGAFGAVYGLTPSLALAANAAYTERAPTYFELYANGPHAATGFYELGNTAFGLEKSRAFDIALRARSGLHSGSIGYFQNRFGNFITLFDTGNTRGADGELNPPDAGDGTSANTGEEILPEQAYRAVPARFRGWEAQGKYRLLSGTGTLDVLGKYDYVRADDRSTGQPLPRIAPHRFGLGLDYRYDRFGALLNATRVAGQDRVSANELPTDGYTMLNAALTYRLKAAGAGLEVFLRATNLLDEEARNHVSVIKDIAPLGRRAAMAGVRGTF